MRVGCVDGVWVCGAVVLLSRPLCPSDISPASGETLGRVDNWGLLARKQDKKGHPPPKLTGVDVQLLQREPARKYVPSRARQNRTMLPYFVCKWSTKAHFCGTLVLKQTSVPAQL